jgi:hypothetical protein
MYLSLSGRYPEAERLIQTVADNYYRFSQKAIGIESSFDNSMGMLIFKMTLGCRDKFWLQGQEMWENFNASEMMSFLYKYRNK